MKLSALERKSVVCLLALLAAALPIIFTACGGAMIAPVKASQQDAAPSITSVIPDTGPLTGGKSVTINGANLTSGSQATPPSITFGGVYATHVTIVSSTKVSVVIPAHAAGNVPVKLISPNGKAAVAAKPFTYISTSPTLSTVVPSSGPVAGGTAVTLGGSNFSNGATVSFGGVPASSVSFVSPTELKTATPAHSAGKVDVTVTNPDGTDAVLPGAFAYVMSSPTVSGVSPNSGPAAGGTAVTLSGTNFASGATVSFGGTAATNVSFVSSTQLKAATPAHAAGAVAVSVTNPDGGNASLANAFTYTSSSPTVSGVSPNSGPAAGGTAVTIAGTNFASGATVSFGGTAAAKVSFVSSTQLTATTPAHAAGAVSVSVTNPDGGNASLANGFTYTSSSPTVSSVSPNSGPAAGGTSVTVNGTNFSSGATVSFGGTAASNVSFVSSTQLKATTPAHAAGAVAVSVTNPDGGSASLANAFTYSSSPATLSSVSPVSGPADGGTSVTISGTNFEAGIGVTFGGLAASSVKVTNSTTIQAVTPAHSAGSVDVTVTDTDGQSATLSSGYAYHSVDLNWDAPSSSPDPITGYDVYRSLASAGPFTKLNGSTPVTGTTFSDPTVQGSTTYYYEVKSVDSDGTESSPDGPVKATTGP